MSKYFLLSLLLLAIPVSAIAGNTAVVRVSFTIPQRVEIIEESVMPEEENVNTEEGYEAVVEEERVIATEEAVRANQKVLVKTVLIK